MEGKGEKGKRKGKEKERKGSEEGEKIGEEREGRKRWKVNKSIAQNFHS